MAKNYICEFFYPQFFQVKLLWNVKKNCDLLLWSSLPSTKLFSYFCNRSTNILSQLFKIIDDDDVMGTQRDEVSCNDLIVFVDERTQRCRNCRIWIYVRSMGRNFTTCVAYLSKKSLMLSFFITVCLLPVLVRVFVFFV